MDKFNRQNLGLQRFNNTGIIDASDILNLENYLDDRDNNKTSGTTYGFIKSYNLDVDYKDENKLISYIDVDNKLYNYYSNPYKPSLNTPSTYTGTIHNINSELEFDIASANIVDGDKIKINSNLSFTSSKIINKEVEIYSDGFNMNNPEMKSINENGYEIKASSSFLPANDNYKIFNKKWNQTASSTDYSQNNEIGFGDGGYFMSVISDPNFLGTNTNQVGNIKRPYQQIKYPSSQKLTNVYFYFSYVNLTNAESQNDNRRVMTVYICGSNDNITYDLLHSNIAQNINWTAINPNFYTVGFINALTNNNEYQYFRIIYNTVNGDNYYAINEIILNTYITNGKATIEGDLIDIQKDNCYIHDLIFKNSNISELSNCLKFSSNDAHKNIIKNCYFQTNEIAILNYNKGIQIENNNFSFLGTNDEHTYIIFFKSHMPSLIYNNVIVGNTNNTSEFLKLVGNDYNNGEIYLYNNTNTLINNGLQKFINVETQITNLKIFCFENNIYTNNFFMYIYNVNNWINLNEIVMYKNIINLTNTANYAGLIALDSPSNIILNYKPIIRSALNNNPLINNLNYSSLNSIVYYEKNKITNSLSINLNPLFIGNLGSIIDNHLTFSNNTLLAKNNNTSLGSINQYFNDLYINNGQLNKSTFTNNNDLVNKLYVDNLLNTNVMCKYYASASTGNGDIILQNKVIDTHNAYNTANGKYTIPVSGNYYISGLFQSSNINFGVNGWLEIYVNYNNTGQVSYNLLDGNRAETAGNIYRYVQGSSVFTANVGDTVALYKNASVSLAPINCILTITKI